MNTSWSTENIFRSMHVHTTPPPSIAFLIGNENYCTNQSNDLESSCVQTSVYNVETLGEINQLDWIIHQEKPLAILNICNWERYILHKLICQHLK